MVAVFTLCVFKRSVAFILKIDDEYELQAMAIGPADIHRYIAEVSRDVNEIHNTKSHIKIVDTSSGVDHVCAHARVRRRRRR